MNTKARDIFSKRLASIQNAHFEEDDIKLLLIEIRDALAGEEFLNEICDFVAHPRRTRGICHKRIDSRYAKLKFSREGIIQLAKEFSEQAINTTLPWSHYSERILSYIETKKIEKNLFEIIIKEGLEEIDEALFIEHYRISKTKVRSLLQKSYKNINGFYVIQSISQAQFRLLDELLKFIRGTITGKAAFSQVDLKCQLRSSMERQSTMYGVAFDAESFMGKIDDIIVCIFSILHGATFCLFDQTNAFGYLSKDPKYSYLCLMAKADRFHFPVISTTIPADNYIDETDRSLLDGEQYASIHFIAQRNKAMSLRLTAIHHPNP